MARPLWFLLACVFLACFSTGNTRSFNRGRSCPKNTSCLPESRCDRPVIREQGGVQRLIRCRRRNVCCWKRPAASPPAPIQNTPSPPALNSEAPSSLRPQKDSKLTTSERGSSCPKDTTCLRESRCDRPVIRVQGGVQRLSRCGRRRRVCCWTRPATSPRTPIQQTPSPPAILPVSPLPTAPNTIVPFPPDTLPVSPLPTAPTTIVPSPPARNPNSEAPSSIAPKNDSKRTSERVCEIYKIYKQELIYSREVNVTTSNTNIALNGPVGAESQINEFPYMVGIGFGRNISNNNPSELLWGCGGSLIHHRYVLTTASCITKGEGQNIQPTVMRTRVNNLEQGVQEPYDYAIENIIIHPLYRSNRKYFDLALLLTDRPVVFSLWEFPICLANINTQIDAKTRFIVASWGAVNTSGFDVSAQLNNATVRFQPLKECDNSYKNSAGLPNGLDGTMICAADTTNITCQSSFGGALVAEGQDGDVLVGVKSFGSRPCDGRKPDVYVSVQSHLPWIEGIVWPTPLLSDRNSTTE